MLNKLQNEWRSYIIFLFLIVMMMGLFFSRALLSVSMITFAIVAFFHADVKKQINQFFTSPLLWGMSLLFFLPLLSGLWSDDKKAWIDIVIIKMPLFFLPLAFAGPVKFSPKQWEWLAYIFITLITTGTIWSMFHYVANATLVNESYLKAKSLITPLENDHVRFSWLISVAILLAGNFVVIKRQKQKAVGWLLSFITLWLIIFLHILAARTGLFSFYITLLIASLWFIYNKLRWQYGVVLMIALIAFPLIAYQTLPTFHNRVKYFMYDLGYFKETHYLPGANDAVRVISLKAGYDIIKENPVTGVGFGDVMTATKNWYALNYPLMTELDKIFPSSEWLIYGAACGIAGLFIFTLVMAIPFFIKTKMPLSWRLLNLIAACSFLFDIGLEVQFGVFIYSFIILWWWKWMTAEKI